jgi:hypothetical protein
MAVSISFWKLKGPLKLAILKDFTVFLTFFPQCVQLMHWNFVHASYQWLTDQVLRWLLCTNFILIIAMHITFIQLKINEVASDMSVQMWKWFVCSLMFTNENDLAYFWLNYVTGMWFYIACNPLGILVMSVPPSVYMWFCCVIFCGDWFQTFNLFINSNIPQYRLFSHIYLCKINMQLFGSIRTFYAAVMKWPGAYSVTLHSVISFPFIISWTVGHM